MYTQCPDCSTVFRVTAEALRVAQGRVRCGICSSEFSALENLSESPVARPLAEPPHEDTITVEELPGNEVIELSGGAEPAEDEAQDLPAEGEGPVEDEPPAADVVEAAADVEEEMPAAVEAATDVEEELPASIEAATDVEEELPAADALEATAETAEERPASGADALDSLPDTALEFHGSVEDLEKLFVPAAARSDGAAPAPADLPQAIEDIASQDLSGIEVREEDLSWPDDDGSAFDPANPAHVAAVLATSSGDAERGDVDDLDRTDEYPVLVVEEYEAARPGDVEPGETPDLEAGQAGPGAGPPAEEPEPPGEATGSEPQDETALLIIPEELRRGPSATAADDLDLDEDTPRRWPLAVAALVLAAALGAQAVHHWRHDLVRSPAAGPWMLRAYDALGLELQPPTDLGRFELRQLGAASDPGQSGRIRVRASIVNHAPFAQPYPLLRLTLQDRFGSTIGARNLGPTEYLPAAAVDASGLLGPSQRADAEVVFVDPGREAVGFELDVCVEGESGLRCSADLPRGTP